MIERKNKLTARIGIFAVAHSAYNKQFEGLYDNLLSYHHELIDKLKTFDVEVFDFGMTDTSEKGFKTAKSINTAGVDLIICNMVTYATSSVFAPVIREVNAPMILTALQPLKHLDYSKASTFMQLENDNICSVPEFMGVAHRLGRRIYDVVIGTLRDDAAAETELSRWCGIAKVLNSLKEARIGLLGHTMEAMYDMHTDPTAVTAAFGIHVPLLEIDDIIEVYNTVTEQRTAEITEIIECEFD